MTENAPIDDRKANVKGVVVQLVEKGLEDIYENLDHLHVRKIDDTEVIRALREAGFPDIAEGYINWADCIDPDREDDNTTTSPVVPDPGDAPSYKSMGTVSSLTKELTDAGINDGNLEQALLDAVSANRIDHGVFYAERSNDGVHWHVYKKRNHYDNGAYIATANDRGGAQFILNSLGTGTVEGQ